MYALTAQCRGATCCSMRSLAAKAALSSSAFAAFGSDENSLDCGETGVCEGTDFCSSWSNCEVFMKGLKNATSVSRVVLSAAVPLQLFGNHAIMITLCAMIGNSSVFANISGIILHAGKRICFTVSGVSHDCS